MTGIRQQVLLWYALIRVVPSYDAQNKVSRKELSLATSHRRYTALILIEICHLIIIWIPIIKSRLCQDSLIFIMGTHLERPPLRRNNALRSIQPSQFKTSVCFSRGFIYNSCFCRHRSKPLGHMKDICTPDDWLIIGLDNHSLPNWYWGRPYEIAMYIYDSKYRCLLRYLIFYIALTQ